MGARRRMWELGDKPQSRGHPLSEFRELEGEVRVLRRHKKSSACLRGDTRTMCMTQEMSVNVACVCARIFTNQEYLRCACLARGEAKVLSTKPNCSRMAFDKEFELLVLGKRRLLQGDSTGEGRGKYPAHRPPCFS